MDRRGIEGGVERTDGEAIMAGEYSVRRGGRERENTEVEEKKVEETRRGRLGNMEAWRSKQQKES